MKLRTLASLEYCMASFFRGFLNCQIFTTLMKFKSIVIYNFRGTCKLSLDRWSMLFSGLETQLKSLVIRIPSTSTSCVAYRKKASLQRLWIHYINIETFDPPHFKERGCDRLEKRSEQTDESRLLVIQFILRFWSCNYQPVD